MHLAGEGNMRVLCALLRSVVARGDTKVVIALPAWSRAALRDVLRDEGVNVDAIEFVHSGHGVPLLVRLRLALERPPRTATWSWIGALTTLWRSAFAQRVVRPLLGTSSVVLAALIAPAALVLGLLGALVLVPVAFVAKWARRAGRRLGSERRGLRLRFPQLVPIAQQVYADVVHLEYERVAARARRLDVEAWLVPMPAWSTATRLGRPLVVVVPDIVYLDFPTLFPAVAVRVLHQEIERLVPSAAAVVSYDEYVQSAHVVEGLGIDAARTRVIRNAPMRPTTPDVAAASRSAAAAVLARHFADAVPAARDAVVRARNAWLAEFPFSEVPFLFVSSQIRPHKNYENLIEAYLIVLRRFDVPVKLFYTGRMTDAPPSMRELIERERVGQDVVSVPHLPPRVLDAFYRLAALSVVPTLFEGGFPFPFTESMSVGTPVVMSSIPVTRREVPEALVSRMLFDPFRPEDMARVIAWGVEHAGELAALQKPLYDRLNARTWEGVASEYVELLRTVARRASP